MINLINLYNTNVNSDKWLQHSDAHLSDVRVFNSV